MKTLQSSTAAETQGRKVTCQVIPLLAESSRGPERCIKIVHHRKKPAISHFNAWMCAAAKGAWVFPSRDLRRGTEPKVSLKQFLSNFQSGTERFYTLFAFWGPHASKLSADSCGFTFPPRIVDSFLQFDSSNTNYKAVRCTSFTPDFNYTTASAYPTYS